MDIYLIPLPWGQHTTIARKEKRRKERRKKGSGQRAKLSNLTQAIDTRMGEEEENNRKQMEEEEKKRKKKESGTPT